VLGRLYIKNIALIDELCMDFENGLNVLTGETGAGKSIIIDSINAVLGVRFSKDFIRTGCEKSLIEASFTINNKAVNDVLDEMGIEPEEDGTIILSRENWVNGRNSCRINGRMSTVTGLKEIGERLIDIHGQHDNQSLLRTESHIDLLDSFGGKKLLNIKERYSTLLKEHKEIRDKLQSLTMSEYEREKRIDFLKFQVEEINNARLIEGEDEELEARRLVLSNAENIIKALSDSYDVLFSGEVTGKSIFDGLNTAISYMRKIQNFGEAYEKIYKELEDLTYQLADITEDLRKERDLINYDSQELAEVLERLDVINRLKRKYGETIKDILEYCQAKENELGTLLSNQTHIEDLKKKLAQNDAELYKAAVELNSERVKAANILEEKITGELFDLEMKKAKFKVNIIFDNDTDMNGLHKFTANGLDKVEFMISPNLGEPLKPLSKIASGGELSRIMLAIKTILADVDNIPVLIFDEVDSGISGRVAQKVGEKLAMLSKGHQVICITHLPQIACMADNHFLIEKVSSEDKTTTVVKKLEDEEIPGGIARLLGGAHISEITIKHASEMLQYSQQFKEALQKTGA